MLRGPGAPGPGHNASKHRPANSDITNGRIRLSGEFTNKFIHKHHSTTVAQPRVYTLVDTHVRGDQIDDGPGFVSPIRARVTSSIRSATPTRFWDLGKRLRTRLPLDMTAY